MQETSRKIILVLAVIVLILLIGFLAWDLLTEGEVLLPTRIVKLLSDAEGLREFILQYEFFAPFVLFWIQLIQVLISPIPGNVTIFIAGNLFGPYYGLLINTLSIYLGSIIAFYLGRRFGKPFVLKIIGEGTYRKYNRFFEKKYIVGLFMIYLFPLFPDDALCLLTGISSIPVKTFLFILIIGRFPGILVGTLVGSGIMELTIREWVSVGILFLIGLIFFIVYGKKIEKWLYNRVVKRER